MPKARPRSVALVCAGSISRSDITRVPNLVSHLGPIKAGTMRVASRAANTLRAGFPVQRYEELKDTSFILISSPAERAAELISALAGAELEWANRVVVLMGSSLDSSQLGQLQAKGATVASLHLVEFPGTPLCIVEGPDAAVRALQNVTGVKLLQVRQGEMPQCHAALCLASHCFLPLFDACVQSLFEAGLDVGQAQKFADRLILRSLSGYAKAGKSSWAPVPREFMLEKAGRLQNSNPSLAVFYSTMFDLAGNWMRRQCPAGNPDL